MAMFSAFRFSSVSSSVGISPPVPMHSHRVVGECL
jgi:hypothetical protein